MSRASLTTSTSVRSIYTTLAAWKLPLGVILIVTLVCFIYRPALSGGFILDDELLTQSKQIKAADGLYQLWFTTKPVDYWPVTSSSFWLEWRLWPGNPTGYHVVNLTLHVLDVLLLWLLLERLAIPGAFLAALLFAVHPVNVESVAWIAQRKNLLAMLFMLLSAWCYLKAEDKWSSLAQPIKSADPKFARSSAGPAYWLSLVMFVLAILSKGSAVVLPALLLLIIWWRRRLIQSDWIRIAPFFVIGGLLAMLNVWFQTHGSDAIVRNVTLLDRLLGAGAVVWFYLFKALIPINLMFVYPQWDIQASNYLWWLPLIAAMAVTAVLIWICQSDSVTSNRFINKKWARPLLFAWAFFCLSLIPVMGFTDVGYMQYSLVADHYQHIAIIGMVALIAAAWGFWHQTLEINRRWVAEIVAVVGVGTLAFLSGRQCQEYSDPRTLYEATLKKNPTCWLAHNNLGNLSNDANQMQDAIQHYKASLSIKPDQPKVYNNLGVALTAIGQPLQGIASFQHALDLDPKFADAEHNWGVALRKLGQPADAIEHLKRAVELENDNAEYCNSLGQALLDTGHYEAAVQCLEMACQLDPENLNSRLALAVAYTHANRRDDALISYQRALEMARAQHQTAVVEQIEHWLELLRNTPQQPRNVPAS